MQYFDEIRKILDAVERTQSDNIATAARVIADAIASHANVYAFGASHAGILAQELFYRTGGLAVINPIMPPGLYLEVRPITMSSEMERIDGYGTLIVDGAGIQKGDVIIIHSVSGRNSVPVEVAIESKRRGAYVIGLTNMAYTRTVSSRHSSGKNLYEVCDLVLDNCGCVGDAHMTVGNMQVAATSTAIGAAMLQCIVYEVAKLLHDEGVPVPVFISANLEGGDAHNKTILETYKENIKYM